MFIYVCIYIYSDRIYIQNNSVFTDDTYINVFSDERRFVLSYLSYFEGGRPSLPVSPPVFLARLPRPLMSARQQSGNTSWQQPHKSAKPPTVSSQTLEETSACVEPGTTNWIKLWATEKRNLRELWRWLSVMNRLMTRLNSPGVRADAAADCEVVSFRLNEGGGATYDGSYKKIWLVKCLAVQPSCWARANVKLAMINLVESWERRRNKGRKY